MRDVDRLNVDVHTTSMSQTSTGNPDGDANKMFGELIELDNHCFDDYSIYIMTCIKTNRFPISDTECN